VLVAEAAGAAPMPGLELYDGPEFRMLRKYSRSESIDLSLLRVVSAEYGLLTMEQTIDEYNRRAFPHIATIRQITVEVAARLPEP